ncbi:hypothetical protein BJX62DRAFT_238269 [Aspergillus germanicus]
MAPKEQPCAQHPTTKHADDDSNSRPEEQKKGLLKILMEPFVLALIFSGACLLAIIAILQSHEGEPAPNLSVSLSLNAIICILSTASRTALIFVASETIGQWKWIWVKRGSRRLQGLQAFDDASRGPWGALVLLFRRACWSLASLGVVITVLALTLEPLMQQLLTYPIRQTFHLSKQNIAKQVTTFLPALDDERFLYAVEGRFWSSGLQFSPSCPARNCTWPMFKSLGFCNRCADVTAEVENCRNVTADPTVYYITYTGCNITLPYGNPPQEPIHVGTTGSGRAMRISSNVIWVTSVFGQAPMDVERGEPRNELLAIAHAKLGVATRDTMEQPHPENGLDVERVTRCTISFCTRESNLTVTSGELLPSGRRQKIQVTSLWPSSQKRLTSASAQYANDSEFTLCPDFNVYHQLAFLFAGSTFQSWNNLGDNLTLWNRTEPQGRPSSMNIRRVLASGPEDATANIVASMTKYTNQLSNWTLTGEAGRVGSYVHVDWRWLVLPVLLLGAERLKLWKSSILPLLHHALNTSSGPRSPGADTVTRMDGLAQETQVRLQRSGDGRLVLQ